MQKIQHARKIVGLLLLSLFTGPVIAASQSYLDALEAAAGDVSPSETAEPAPGAEPPPAQDGEKLATGLDKQQFEKALEEKYTGTYVFYRKLAPADKEAVYREYQNNSSLGTIRDAIMSHLKI